MQTFVQRGKTVTLTPSSAVSAGGGCLFSSSLFGVAASDVASGAPGEFVTDGVVSIAKDTGAVSVGAPLYWNASTKKVTASSVGSRVGTAVADALSADARVSMLMAQPAVSVDGNPENYLWAGSATASGVGASDALQIAATSGTWTLTAGASVTAATVRFEGSQDGSVWAGICTISLTAPGSAQAPLGLQYAYTRANVVAVSGGSVSASFAPNVTPIAAPSANVGINPVLAGIPLPAPYTLAQWAVPVMLPPSGTVGSNGALTLGTALPEIYSLAASSGCWMFFPAGAVYSGSAAGVYYVIMSSTTVGTVYNTTLPYGTVPYVPSAPVAVSGTGTSYTTPTLSSFALVQIPVLGGSLGPNGILRLESDWQVNNNANIKVPGAFISPTISGAGVASSGLLLANPGMANTVTLNLTRRVRARGRQTAVFAGFAAGAYGSSTIFGGNPVVSTGYDMTIAQNVTFTAYLATATDYMILQAADLQISYGA